MEYINNIKDVTMIVYIIKLFTISNLSYYTSLRITNNSKKLKCKMLEVFISILFVNIICTIVKYFSGSLSCILLLIMLLAIIVSKILHKDIVYSLIVVAISLGINYVIFLLSTFIVFFPVIIMNLKNEYINLILILIVYMIGVFLFFKVKRFKKGFIFLQNRLEDEYFNLLILSVSIVIIFLFIMLENYHVIYTSNIGIGFIIFGIIMFATIQKALQLYYKQKLLVQALNATKKELQEEKQLVKELENEIFKRNKKDHSISHQQRILKHKVNKLMEKSEIASEITIIDKINKIDKEIADEKAVIELAKTEIIEIDDVLDCEQAECEKNKIEFELQLNENIHKMVNNYISAEDLQILIADNIKNARIAIQHSNNTYKSIMVRLGKIDGYYSLYVYDSGVEFEEGTLEKLGKVPSTTHKDSGGLGLGFMNIFDTLNKYKASITIKEIGKPSITNYTKAIMIKFDNKNAFNIDSYRR